MRRFCLDDYPKFIYERGYTFGSTWEEDLWVDGFKSAREVYGREFEMSAADYTWFVMRWS